MRKLLTLSFLLVTTLAIAQNAVWNELEGINSFEKFEFISEAVGLDADLPNTPEYVQIDPAILTSIYQQQSPYISFTIPSEDYGNMEVKLVEHEIFTSDFKVFNAGDEEVNYHPGKHYKGIVDGQENSVVALSIYPDEVMGILSTDEGNFVLGKIANSRTMIHSFYNDLDFDPEYEFSCGTDDDGNVYSKEALQEAQSGLDVGDCIKVYIEINDDIVDDKGGVTPATNFITGLFNQSIVLYDNENIEMSISEIKAWNNPSPYSGSNSSAMLSSYQAQTGSFNGDLSHLVAYNLGGGVAAGFSGICNSNPDLSKCVSGIFSTYSNVPTYSWSVYVVTHEMGHLIGSRHTHACVWNGNGTAIDGCSGFTEGNCAIPSIPSGGGTIMSYCHTQSTGISFNKGFGTQPGNVIRNTVNASGNCLSPCGGGPGSGYCASSGTNVSYEWVQRVQANTINNNSGANGGYADFTSQSTDLEVGTAYTLTLTPGFASSTYQENWRVWIDYNGDDDFDDAGEQVAQGAGTGVVNVSFTVPNGSSLLSTRMRVSMQWNNYAPPCGSFTYGEVEDYTVNITETTQVEYCDSKGNNTNYEWINRVRLGSIDNTSGSNNGYGDFTSLSTNIARGSNYTITMYPGFASSSYQENWRVWIDYNHDGDFTDAGEQVAQGAGTGTVNQTISVPNGIATGNTRMRVSMQWNTYPSSCQTFTYGEVEDYTVNVTGGSGAPQVVLEGETKPEDILVYPNPFSDEINIQNMLPGDNIQIVGVTGKSMSVATVGDSKNKLNVSNLNSGVYYLTIQRGDELIQQKIVKM